MRVKDCGIVDCVVGADKERLMFIGNSAGTFRGSVFLGKPCNR